MLVLLPPSETKSPGGSADRLNLRSLSFPALAGTRRQVLDALAGVSGDIPAARRLLGVPASKDDQIIANTRLLRAPTSPAVLRYTGVLYDALDAAGMSPAQRARAAERIAITSALFGLLRPDDAIPAYRLSAGSRLPGLGSLAARWRPAYRRVLADLPRQLVVDLRSGAYAAFGRCPGAIEVRVVTVAADGGRRVVSHFNKHGKGLLARALAVTRAEVTDLAGVLRVARRAGLTVQATGPASLEIVTDPVGH